MQKSINTLFTKPDAAYLITTIGAEGYVINGDIKCSELNKINLNSAQLSSSSPEAYKKDLVEVCNNLDYMLNEDYNYDALRQNFIDLTTGTITYIRKDIARTGSQGVSTLIVNLFEKELERKLEIRRREEAVRDANLEKGLREQLTKIAANENKEYLLPFDSAYDKAKQNLIHALQETPSHQEPPPKTPTKPYLVKSGDTLSKIAVEALGSKASPAAVSRLLDDLINLNPELSENPNFIKVGQVLELPTTIPDSYYEHSPQNAWLNKGTCPRGLPVSSSLHQMWVEGVNKYTDVSWWNQGWERGLRDEDLFGESWYEDGLSENALLQNGDNILGQPGICKLSVTVNTQPSDNKKAESWYGFLLGNKNAESNVVWFREGDGTIDESKAATWVKRPLDMDKKENIYTPSPIYNNLISHWGLSVMNNEGQRIVVGYFEDSHVRVEKNAIMKEVKKYYTSYKIWDFYEVYFNNKIMWKSYEKVKVTWDKNEKDTRYDGKTYDWRSHNCQDFLIQVFEEYKNNGGKFYFKKPTLGEVFAKTPIY